MEKWQSIGLGILFIGVSIYLFLVIIPDLEAHARDNSACEVLCVDDWEEAWGHKNFSWKEDSELKLYYSEDQVPSCCRGSWCVDACFTPKSKHRG